MRVSDVTQILERVEQGDPKAADELLALVYEDLRRLAAYRMSSEAQGHTLQPTALVHEAWMRLVGKEGQANFKIAPTSLPPPPRRCAAFSLIAPVASALSVMVATSSAWIFWKLTSLLRPTTTNFLPSTRRSTNLPVEHKVEAELVKLRYFVGMTNEEAAEALDISPRTAKYHWTHARAWLFREIKASESRQR